MNVRSPLKPKAMNFFPPFLRTKHVERKMQLLTQIDKSSFTEKDTEFTRCLLDEWYSGRTLSPVLQQWEEHNNKYLPTEKVPLSILCCNVKG